ncbi:MAG: TetR/AcrR family transcriptional regulator [Rhodospirillales bacterium]|nr:TetR/AcrR family transcriptional regulator [Rhodospirillales bacterium]
MSTIQDEKIFAVVGAQLADIGTVTLQSIVKETGVSVGSLYHRYNSREELLARTWLDAVKGFHSYFLRELESQKEDAGARAAMATPRFCRAERARAIVLSCCRQSEFLSSETPKELRDEIGSINDKAFKAVREYAKHSGYSLEACKLGLVAFPLGAVRQYLPSHKVPTAVDEYVAAAFRAVVQVKT